MRTPLALTLALALAACQRPQPSADYEQGRALHAALVARSPLDPYAQPQMAEVVELLARVPADSLDAEAARTLREKVDSELKAQAEERTRRARLVAGAGGSAALPAMAQSAAPADAPPAPAEQPAPEAERPASQLSAGTTLAEFQKSQGECFEAKAPARIQGEGTSVAGQAWGLKETEACKKAHPDEVGRVVLFADGKLLDVRDSAETRVEKGTSKRIEGEVRPDGTYALPKGVELPPGDKVKWDQPPAKPAPGTAPATPPAPAR